MAPQLRDLEWLAGEPMNVAEGRVVVVEFFSTFCPLSRLAIPTLTKLQRRYQESVCIVGVAPAHFDSQRDAVASLVTQWDARIGYAVAWDAKNHVKADWFDASEQSGYPVAFVVDRHRKIAWIGSPLDGLDQALAQVATGKFDVDLARQAARLQKSLARAQSQSDSLLVLDLTQQWIALEPKRAQPWVARFVTLADDLTAADAAMECARKALEHLAPAPAELARFANDGLFAVADATDCHALGLQSVREAFAKDDADPQLAVAYFSALAATGKDHEADKIAARAVHLARDDTNALVALARQFIERRHGKRFVAPALAAIRRAIELESDNHQLDLMEFGILATVAGDDDAARLVGQRLVQKAKLDEVLLNQFAWDLLDKPKLRGRFDKLALLAAEATHVLKNGGHWAYVDTLARAKFVNGQVADAVRLQRAAVQDCDSDTDTRAVRERLRAYEKAAAALRK